MNDDELLILAMFRQGLIRRRGELMAEISKIDERLDVIEIHEKSLRTTKRELIR